MTLRRKKWKVDAIKWIQIQSYAFCATNNFKYYSLYSLEEVEQNIKVGQNLKQEVSV